MNKAIKVLILVAVLAMVSRETFAFEASYFRRFIGKEITLGVQLGENRTKMVLMFVKDVDVSNGIIIGKTNLGIVHIPAEKVFSIQEQRPDWHGVYNVDS